MKIVNTMILFLIGVNALADNQPTLGGVIESKSGHQMSAVCTEIDSNNKCTEISIILTSNNGKSQTLFKTQKTNASSLNQQLEKNNQGKPVSFVKIDENWILIAIICPPAVAVLPLVVLGEIVSYPFRAAGSLFTKWHLKHRVNVGNKALNIVLSKTQMGTRQTVSDHRFNLIMHALHTLGGTLVSSAILIR